MDVIHKYLAMYNVANYLVIVYGNKQNNTQIHWYNQDGYHVPRYYIMF